MKINRYSILAVSISLCLSSAAYGGGFTVTVQSASGGGTAATNHAMAEDASVMFYNPALLSSVEGTQVNGGISLTSPDLTVTNTGSTLPPIAGGAAINPAVESVEPTELAATPSMFYKRDISPKLAFGLGVNVPHGVSSEYEKSSFARYEATESGLTTLNINPALSWKIGDKLALGVGANIQYGTATLARQIDSYLLCANLAAFNALNDCNSLGGPQASDESSTVEADGVAYGFNIGGAYHPNTSTTISVGYRSSIKHELEGEVDLDDLTATAVALGGTAGAAAGENILGLAGFTDQKATADLELPATASISFAKKLNAKLSLHGDVTWTDWSSVPEIRIVFPDSALSDSVTDLQWEDTIRVGAGATYQLNKKTKLRAGIALDPTPTPSSNNRTPRAPSSDNIWLAVGIGHDFSKKLSIDASLAYIHPEDSSITYTAVGATPYHTRADVEASAISAALSVNYRFK